MKKITAIILAALICFAVTACKSLNNDVSSTTTTSSIAESSLNEQTVQNSSDFYENNNSVNSNSLTIDAENVNSQDSYEDVECVTVTSYKEIRVLPTDSKENLVLKVPQEWKIENADQGFNIVKNSKIIGTITDTYKLKGKIEHTSETKLSFGGCNYSITKIAAKQYNRTFGYTLNISGSKKIVSICVDYAELDYESFYELFYNAGLSRSTHRSNMGSMSIIDNRKKVAIFGNSFIATSQVGNILQQMCGNKIEVEAQSRGNSKISTYAQDGYTLQRIESGEFSVVMTRGLYDHTDIESLEKIAAACKASNTQLVVFPAHNENDTYIALMQEKFPNTLLLNWKAEIEGLIANGILKSEFCVDDGPQHSTPLAGYVGAHMIYRAIFGKVPTQKSFSEVSSYQINLLGNYVNTGLVDSSIKDEYEVYRF